MNKIGIYLHFPFCKKKCSYCDFYSRSSLHQRGEYEKKLCQAITSFAPNLSDYEADTVYFGGGTPGLISASGLKAVFDALRQAVRLSDSPEITMELNPESTTKELLKAAKEVGINRISFGMQSGVDEELFQIGRIHTHKEVERAVFLARDLGFENVSLDLMYGLPGQDLSSFRESLEKCLALNPKHVSFYCLTLSEKVPLYQRKEELPDEDALREMYLFASRYLTERGFEHYEISNASLKGFESRHNLGYWERKEYLGIGPGAHSFFQGERFFMAEDLDRFLSAQNVSDVICDRVKMTEEDAFTEYVMLSLRQKKGISLEEIRLLCGEAKQKRVEEKMALWSRHGLCRKTEKGYALTPQGFFVSNEIILELI